MLMQHHTRSDELKCGDLKSVRLGNNMCTGKRLLTRVRNLVDSVVYKVYTIGDTLIFCCKTMS